MKIIKRIIIFLAFILPIIIVSIYAYISPEGQVGRPCTRGASPLDNDCQKTFLGISIKSDKLICIQDDPAPGSGPTCWLKD